MLAPGRRGGGGQRTGMQEPVMHADKPTESGTYPLGMATAQNKIEKTVEIHV